MNARFRSLAVILEASALQGRLRGHVTHAAAQGPMLGSRSAMVDLKFLVLFKQRAVRFRFALGSARYIACGGHVIAV